MCAYSGRGNTARSVPVLIGAFLWIVGALGHEVGGRKHYW